MQFDLFSDLHIDRWPQENQIDWEGLPSSLVAVIAGDVSSDPTVSMKTVIEISKHYKHVMFVDGNHEHGSIPGIKARNDRMNDVFSKYSNISYLYKNTMVLDDVAFVGSNGWWSYDFAFPLMDRSTCFERLIALGWDKKQMFEYFDMAQQDAATMADLVTIFNEDDSVQDIVMVTHTVPFREFRYKNAEQDVAHYGRCGSLVMQQKCLEADENDKINTWCFGHVHQSRDVDIDAIRYVSNPRGVPSDSKRFTYYPKVITI